MLVFINMDLLSNKCNNGRIKKHPAVRAMIRMKRMTGRGLQDKKDYCSRISFPLE